MTINIQDLTESTKKELDRYTVCIQALNELKVINGLTHRQHEKINKILQEHGLDKKYKFIFNKVDKYVQGSAYLLNLENDDVYFKASPMNYGRIIITDETIEFAKEDLAILQNAHNYALEKEEEIKKSCEELEKAKASIKKIMKSQQEIASEFWEKYTHKNSSSIYINVDTRTTIDLYL